mgnify:CR=1 FL=1|tara:strand:- start:7386 stop:7859 length:474 start_codon:yes stop_codon:yes gene_type:complete
MNTTYYDFESALEAGFKTLFDAAGLALRVADDIGEGELPDECLMLEIDTGSPISNQHQNNDGIYDNYGGTFTVTIETPRVPGDQVATIGSGFKNRHRELVARSRKTLEEIDAGSLLANWPGALSPTKITPSGSERENDKDSQITTLSYAFQFRILDT